MEEQRQREVRSPYYFPAAMSQPAGDAADLALQSDIARLSISSEFDGDRYRQMTAVVGSSRVGGSRLDPPIAYEGNVEEGLLTTTPRVAHNGYGDFMGFGGAHLDSNVGQPWIWPTVSTDLQLRGSTSGGSNLGASAAATALPWIRHRVGEESPHLINGESLFHDDDPFLLRKESLFGNPIPKSTVLNVEKLRGKIVYFAKHQIGCRILQNSLNLYTNEEIEVVLSEVIGSVGDLLKNQSGSYLIQKLFSVCSEQQKLSLIMALTMKPFELVYICLNSFGARAMQKILEDLSSPQLMLMVMSALSLDSVTLACDTNGHLVVLHCLNNLSFEFNERLINGIADKCFRVATNIRGCRVLQLCVENARGEVRKRLIYQILASAVHLSGDPYGNYVVQHLLEQNIPGVEETLLKYLEGRFALLSCNKYSSNVVEKFLVKSGENSAKIIMELITSPVASMLLVDPFANYVIQKALEVAKGELRTALVNLILVNASSMQCNKHGRKILAWFDSRR